MTHFINMLSACKRRKKHSGEGVGTLSPDNTRGTTITNRGHPPGDAKGVLRALGARVAAPVTGVRGAPPPRTGSPGAVVSWGGVFAASGAAPRRAAARGYSAHDAINAIKTHRANIQCGKRTSVGPCGESDLSHSTTSCTTEQPVSRGACKASEESQVTAKKHARGRPGAMRHASDEQGVGRS